MIETAENRLSLGDMLLAGAIVQAFRAAERSIVVGLAGGQGSGKSTTARRLAARLGEEGLKVVTRSLDDFYRTKADRQRLGAEVHPLFVTRGVPGTHDIPLLLATLAALKEGRATPLPTFDKSRDDRLPQAEWPIHTGRADILLLEGWCVGARPQPAEMLAEPINALEREEDGEGVWRRAVNRHLETDYADFRAQLDLTILLKVPAFDRVHQWRAEQEANDNRAMDAATLTRFIAHYERLTRWMLADEPADLIVDLDAERSPQGWRFPHHSA